MLAKILVSFKKGDYFAALDKLEVLRKDPKFAGIAYYWMGHINFKLQEYDKSIEKFKTVLARGLKGAPPEIYYEYGQAQYVAENLKVARQAFVKSYQKGVKRAISLYYAGYISQTMKQYKSAREYYKAIRKLPLKERLEVQQASEYQNAELSLMMAREKKYTKKQIEEIVLPGYINALAIDEKGSLVKDIEDKIYKIKEEFGLIVTKLWNGKKVPKKRYTARATFSNKYDTNINATAEEAASKPDNRDTTIHKVEAFGSYKTPFKDLAIFTFEGRIDYSYHTDRQTPAIYKNDNYNLAHNIRSDWGHYLFTRRASFLLDLELSLNAKDRNSKKQMQFNNRAMTISVGEKFSYFKFGPTTLRLKRKHTWSATQGSDSKTHTLSITQMVKTPWNHNLILINNNSRLRNANPSSDTNSYALIANYIIPAWKGLKLVTLGWSYTLTDTMNNRSTRGYESNFSPNIAASYFLMPKLKMTGKYTYTKVISKNKTANQYEKNVVNLDFVYTF
jgi:hypothetical protein